MTTETVIRVSSLPSYADCARRDAARSRRQEIEAAGYALRETGKSIGAVIGTATHAALEAAFRAKLAGDTIAPSEFADRAEAEIREGAASGIIWDDTSKNSGDATRQAVKQSRIIWDTYRDRLEPVAIEERVQADLGDGFILRGHIDVRGYFVGDPRLVGGGIADFKTGTVMRANAIQYGGYGLVARANRLEVNWAAEIYAKRVAPTKPQPEPLLAPYDVAEAERGAWEVAHKMKADLEAFRASGNPWAFLPNPNSMNCSDKYCPAWGTGFCKAHKGEIEK